MKVRVLVVDDSALMRRLLREILSADPEIEVVGAVNDPIAAWKSLGNLKPDVLTLDVEMPKMDGIAFLERLMRAKPMPVVMVSSLTEKSCETTMRALELGAVDFVTKPRMDIERGTVDIAEELIAKVKAAANAKVKASASGPGEPAMEALKQPSAAATFSTTAQPSALHRVSDAIIAIGASTGGTEAIAQVLRALPPDAPGIVIVQHMPAKFTKQFADRLDRTTALRVREACDGDRIIPGQVLIAPGGMQHMEVARSGASFVVKLIDGPPLHHSRPAVDVLLNSVATVLGKNAVGVILTGMGCDGAAGLLAMRKAGAVTMAQDEATSIVYGMPKEAAVTGAAAFVYPLSQIAGKALEYATAASHRRG